MIPVNTLLTYGGPPVIGAFIGYLTNKIAIRMLFRPLKPWYIFGFRVPMTPGVIPSRRELLADNIGEMVGRHLLTSRDIGTALSEEPFQEHLHGIVDARVRELLSRDYGPVVTMLPRRFQAYFKIGVRTVKYQLREGVHRYLESRSFEQAVSALVAEQLAGMGHHRLNELVTADDRVAVYTFIDNLIMDLLQGPGAENWLTAYLARRFDRAAEEGLTLADHLPEPLLSFIIRSVEQQSPRILKKLSAMLSEPAVRDRIIHAVRDGVNHFLDSLGPVGAMARGFLDMETLEAKIREYLLDKEDEIILWLQEPELQERLATVLVEQTERFLHTPLARFRAKVDDAQYRMVCRQVAIQILGVLRSRGVAETLSTLIRNTMEEKLGHGERELAEIMEQFFPDQDGQRLHDFLTSEAVALVRSRKVVRILDRMVNTMVDSLVNRPVGVLHRLMPQGIRTGITDYIVLSANRMLLKEVPGLVESLNIRRVVADKVNSLDLLQLERLLLSIMEEQFKYINLFGALLGFLIGLVNLLILQL